MAEEKQTCETLTRREKRRKPPPGKTLDQMWTELDVGAALFSACWNAPIPRVAVENPVMHRYAKERIVNFRPAAQTVQPWWFGEFWPEKIGCDAYSVLRQPCGDETKECGNPGKK